MGLRGAGLGKQDMGRQFEQGFIPAERLQRAGGRGANPGEKQHFGHAGRHPFIRIKLFGG